MPCTVVVVFCFLFLCLFVCKFTHDLRCQVPIINSFASQCKIYWLKRKKTFLKTCIIPFIFHPEIIINYRSK